ncbi:hypothetical protein AA14362_1117 [Acetobacter cerevisiae DSM 14362]|nr:hypothetical protein AA14362_1117 [Acetobacter cerevisiae DSM 14362]
MLSRINASDGADLAQISPQNYGRRNSEVLLGRFYITQLNWKIIREITGQRWWAQQGLNL